MDSGITVLMVVCLLAGAAVIALLVWAAFSYEKERGGGASGPCLPPRVVTIPDNAPQCIRQGKATSYYYIGQLAQEYDYVVAPFTQDPLDVCIGYCCTYDKGVCNGPNYNGQSAQANFDKCLAQLRPPGCSLPLPIARKGAIDYYAFSPTCALCDGCTINGDPCTR